MKKIWILLLILLFPAHPFPSCAETPGSPGSASVKRLRVAVMEDPPYTFKTDDGKWTGFAVDLWARIARDNKWDYQLVEMPLSDIIQSLRTKTVDLSIACMFQTPEREKQFEFSTALGSVPLGLATLPDRIEHPWLSALRILVSWSTLKVIGLLFFLLFITGFILWLIERKRNPDHFGGGFIKGLSSGFYWVGSTLASGACYGVDLKSLPGRLAGLFWMFVCTVVLSAFIASLTSSLTLTGLTSNQVDMQNLKSMSLGALRGSVSAALLQKMNMKCVLFTNERDILEALTGRHIDGFIHDQSTLNYYAARIHHPALVVHTTRLRRLQYAFGLPTGSPLRKDLNVTLLSLMNEPYWDFLTDYYGLYERRSDQPPSSFHHTGRPGS